MNKGVKIGIAVVIVAGLGAAAYAAKQKSANKATVVKVEAVENRDLVASVTASGQVSPRTKVDVSADITGALATPRTTALTEWPVGSVIVKEGFSGDSRKLVAVMEKRADGWFWAEYDDGGDSKYSGRPSVCTDCHDNRKGYSDWVYAFELPR